MTTKTYEANGIKLNARQYDALRSALTTEGGWLAARGATALALVRRELAEKDRRVWFKITDAGRAWLEAYDSAQAVAQANEKTEQLQHAADAFYSIATNPSGEISHYESMPYRRALSDFRAHLELNFPDLAERSYELAHLWAGDFGTEPVAEAARALREKVADEKAMAAELTETEEETVTEDPRNPVIVHYAGPDDRTACGMLLSLVEAHQFHRAVDFNGDEDATHAECIAYAKSVIEDAAAEQAAYQSEVDAEPEPRAYEPSAVVHGLITFYQTKIGHPLDIRAGILGAIREAVRIEAGMTDAEALEWVRKIS